MHYITTGIIKMFLLLVLQVFLHSTLCLSESLNFLDTDESHGIATLQRDIKIPIGVVDDTVHNFTLAKGTLISEIPSKISQKREEIGLPPHISLEQQDNFFQDFCWQIANHEVVKAPTPGKILQVFVHKGQQIEKGEILCIIEVMKMYITVTSPSPGEITQLSFKSNDLVDNDSILISLLPTSPRWKDIDQTQILESKDLLLPFFPWATSSLIEANPPVEPSPNNRQENEDRNASVGDGHYPLPQTLQEENLLFSSIQNPPLEVAQISPEESAFIEQNSIPLPKLQTEESIPLTHNEQKIEPQNFPLTNISPMSEASALMPRAYPHFFKALALPNSDLSSGLNGEKNTKYSSLISFIKKENLFLKKRTEKEIFYNKFVFSISKSKKLLEERLVSTFEDEVEFSMFSWSKWLFGLLFLGKLITLTKIATKRRLIYLRLRTLQTYNFNNYKVINEKIASNMNQTPWPQEKRLKIHML